MNSKASRIQKRKKSKQAFFLTVLFTMIAGIIVFIIIWTLG